MEERNLLVIEKNKETFLYLLLRGKLSYSGLEKREVSNYVCCLKDPCHIWVLHLRIHI